MKEIGPSYGANGEQNYAELNQQLNNLRFERNFVQDMVTNPSYGTREPIDDILLSVCIYTASAKNTLNFYNQHLQMKKIGRSAGFHYPSKLERDLTESQIRSTALWFSSVQEMVFGMSFPNAYLLREYIDSVDQLVFEAEAGPLYNLPKRLQPSRRPGKDGPEYV